MSVRSIITGVIATVLFALPSISAASQDDAFDQAAAVYELAQLTAPVKSKAALRLHLSQDLHSSPLRYLSSAALRRFTESITFNEKGVTGFSYEDIERELTVTQAYEVLGLFGQQHFIPYLKGARVETGLDEDLLSGKVPGIGIQCGVSPWIPPLGNENRTHEVQPSCSFLEGYRCESRATCGAAMRKACTSNC